MRFALPLAALLALGAASAAQAQDRTPPARSHHQYMMSDNAIEPHHIGRHVHHQRCIGLAAGTAHHSCGGTHTGGPVGGLH